MASIFFDFLLNISWEINSHKTESESDCPYFILLKKIGAFDRAKEIQMKKLRRVKN